MDFGLGMQESPGNNRRQTPREDCTYFDPDDGPSRAILHLLMVEFLNLLTEIGRRFFCVSKYVLVVPVMTESL